MRSLQIRLLLIFALTFVTVAGSGLRVDPITSLLVDQQGRFRVMHGMNSVYKEAPYYPRRTQFNPNDSLVAEDFDNFRRWGITSLRLYIAWQGFEPKPQQYNYTYLEVLREIVREAQTYGVNVIIDAHHDLYSKKFCGEGFPSWVANASTFPAPLKVKLRYDEEGNPLKQDCMKIHFATYYIAYDVVNFSHDFFTNKHGINDKFIAMWRRVMEFFRDEDNVIGYDILNEPTGGNLWKNPYSLIGPDQTNNRLLLPFYRKLSKQLRPVQPKKLFMFEPFPLDMIGGFEGPFSNYSSLDLLDYHTYCPWMQKHGSGRCKWYHSWYMDRRHKNIKQLGVGGILTEFGSVFEEEPDIAEIKTVLRNADKHLVSWYYWQYKYNNDSACSTNPPWLHSLYFPNGTLQEKKARAITYSHFYALCGRFDSQSHTDSSYSLTFFPGRCGSKTTEIFLDEEYALKDGWLVEFKPACEDCRLRRLEKGYYELIVTNEYIGRKLTVTVGAKINGQQS